MTVKISGGLPSGNEARYDGTIVKADDWMLDDPVECAVECAVDAIEQKADGEIIRKRKATHVEVGDKAVKATLARLYDERMSVGSMFPEGTTVEEGEG